MNSRQALKNSLWLVTGTLMAAALPTTAFAQDPTNHLEWAELMVDTIDPANNSYGSPTTVYWEGYDGHTYSYNQSKCAPFVTNTFTQAYDTDFSSWMGCTSPSSYTYHETIVAEDGFTRITNIDDVEAGDIVAIYYLDGGCTNLTCGGFQTCTSTGHTAIVESAPVSRTASSPVISGTVQYAVSIIDSSSSYHGSADTRYQAEADGSHDSGAGQGTMRIYADATTHEIVGYTWSTFSNSAYYDQSSRNLVVGRYVAP